MRTGHTFSQITIGRWRYAVYHSIAASLLSLVVGACGSDSPVKGQIGYVSSDFGGIVADEPRSALIGRDILSSGGNAIDAVVATYFAMSVTYPGAATLGGGGMCVVYSGEGDELKAIDFRPKLFERNGKKVMIPGAVRGMFAIHARYGSQNWESLLLPAERMARFGNPVSRAFAVRLAETSVGVWKNSSVRQLFSAGGRVIAEGEILRQFELSSTLARIRVRGVGDFYAGTIAKMLARHLGGVAGVKVPVSALRDYRPVWLKTEKIDIGKDELHLPGSAVGSRAASIWREAADGYDRRGQAPYDSAGIVAVDRGGGAAACVVSANGVLGAGRMIGPSGILMAAPPRADAFPGVPMLLVNRALKDVRGAASGSGGTDGTARAIAAARRTFNDEVLPEKAFGPVEGVQGRAGLIYCPEGARETPDSCKFGADPAGFGLAVSAAP